MANKPKEATVQSWIGLHPELYYDPASNFIYCSKCESSITAKLSSVQRHVKGPKHKGTSKKPNEEFYLDLVQFLILCNIPWIQVNNPAFKKFFHKYICCNCTNRQKIPEQSLLRKVYLDKIFKTNIDSIYEQTANKKLWVSLDETTDFLDRYMVHFLVKPLNAITQKPFLVACKVLEIVNGNTIAQFVTDCLENMWRDSYESKVGDVAVLCTDSVAYMLKAGRVLKNYMPNMIHVTCLAHALNLVAEKIRYEYSDVDELISNVKKIFLKSPNRVRLLKNTFPDMPLPPEPVITRWGTWLEAVSYYAKYYDQIKTIVNLLRSSDALSIRCAKNVLQKENLKSDLDYIEEYFKVIQIGLKKSQKSNLTLTESFEIFDHVRTVLSWCSSEPIKNKLDHVMDRNPDLDKIRDICDAIKAEGVERSYYMYAPLTSVDVERSFSTYKWIFNIKRNRLTVENIEKIMIVYFNLDDSSDKENFGSDTKLDESNQDH